MTEALGLLFWAILFWLPFCKPLRQIRREQRAKVSRNQTPKNMEPVEQLWMEDDLDG